MKSYAVLAAIGRALWIVLWAQCISLAYSEDRSGKSYIRKDCDYEVVIAAYEKLGTIPFTFPLSGGERAVPVFMASGRSLVLTAAKVNGRWALDKVLPTDVDFEKPECVDAVGETFTYLTSVEEGLLFIPEEFASLTRPHFARVKFPPEWANIELRYKIVFPNNTLTRELVLRISRVAQHSERP